MAQHTKKVSKWPEGPKKHAAASRLKTLTKKQSSNISRNRKGQAPKPRKILSK